MGIDTILYEVADRVATIRLNRPKAMNAFGEGMREALLDHLHECERDKGVRCIVITGVGKAFCAGGDIASMEVLQQSGDLEVLNQRLDVAREIVCTMRALPKPIIAAVNGAAAGAGINLALACDFRCATARAKFSEAFVKIGLIPDWAGHYLLTQIVGTGRAMELIMSGERFDAQEAHRLGIVNRVFDDETFFEQVFERARALADGPAQALAAIKRGVYLGASATLEQTLAFEAKAQRELFLSEDAREGMRAFMQKRAPRFGD